MAQLQDDHAKTSKTVESDKTVALQANAVKTPTGAKSATSVASKPAGVVDWRAHQGPQTRFHVCPAYELLFGGTKGPGKTDCLLREALRQIHKPNYRSIIFRRTYPNLREIIDRSFKYFPGLKARYNNQDHRWTFPSGATVAFGHLQHEHSKYNYQGHEYHYIGFDQLEEFTETQYLFILAQNRSSDSSIRCYIRATANPGGVGHGWVKRRFIEQVPINTIKFFKRVEDEDIECLSIDPMAVSRAFIPATVYDNPSLVDADPGYVKRLEQLPEDDKQALLYGNWDIFKGQYFKQWRRAIHVKDREVLKEYTKFISLDYGYANPSSVGWWLVDFDGNLHRYREFYKEGLTYSQLGEKVMSLTSSSEKIDYCVADPSIWGDRAHHQTPASGLKGESGAETLQNVWLGFTSLIKGDNSRVTGWGRIRELLVPYHDQHGELCAKFTVSPNCKDFIRTFPILIHDEIKVEDINTDGEDHAADEARYAVMSRPETPVVKKPVSFEEAAEQMFDPFTLPPVEEDFGHVSGGVEADRGDIGGVE